jgi:hypothetical protein
MSWESVKVFFGGISTPPKQTSWKWKGKTSPLAFAVLHAIFVARIFSLLQIFKFAYRRRSPSATVDKSSKRKNIPSWFVEAYFIAWMVLLFVLPAQWPLARGLSYYFLFESLVWLLYYFFFRRFFEENYAIMHALEYIVLLPVQIVIQTRCISIIHNMAFFDALGLLFFPEKNDSVYAIVFSVLYTALIFGIFLSSMPMERVKEKGNYRYNISIIGNGEIVQKRLKPAIERLSELDQLQRRVAVLDIQETLDTNGDCESITKFTHLQFQSLSELDKSVLSSNILWIASPSYVHLNYLNRYIANSFIAVEKPIVVNRSEMTVVKQLRKNGMWGRVFCLGYYYLEKALPMTFLSSPSSFYEKYLNFNGLSRPEVLALFVKLGKLECVELKLFEGEDNRDWVENPLYGGHIYETFLHLVVMARAAIGIDADWGTPQWTIETEGTHYMSHIHCVGNTTNLVHYDLEMRKHVDPSRVKRGGKMVFSNGHMDIDLDAQSVVAYDNHGELFRLSTLSQYTGDDKKYCIQVDMVERCFEESIMPMLIDGSDLQIKSLDWLNEKEPEWKKAMVLK